MTNPRRYQHAAAIGAIVLAAATAGALASGLYVPACGFGFGVLVLVEAALREHRRVNRAQLECEWARRRALGMAPPPLDPCCLLSLHSHGQAHDRKCTGDHSLAQFIDDIEQQYGETA
ncbi:hypothetical protein [Streptomyces sp. EKS3.2]|uniref:hypothetical protein n=1 Tax=Streptomyces sp. EKS3.2 TaxID=3461008 RepID=UPI0040437B61